VTVNATRSSTTPACADAQPDATPARPADGAADPRPAADAVPDAIPTVTRAELIAAGRTPEVPAGVVLDDGRTLVLRRLLRVLPGKRLVAEADFDGARVLAKLYLAPRSTVHWQRERQGLAHLVSAGLPTPPLVVALPLRDGGHAVLTRFLASSETVAEAWRRVGTAAAGAPDAIDVLTPAFRLLGRMHGHGLTHDDLHLGNFLRSGGTDYVIDGDAIRRHAHVPLDLGTAHRNLALLIAQLPIGWDDAVQPLIDAYQAENPYQPVAAGALARAVADVRGRRLSDYLAKARRECTLFHVEQRFDRRTVSLRSAGDELAALLDDPDAAVARGELLKDGRTSTVSRVCSSARTLVIKRYNLKNAGHAFSRLWRPSRAWHSWIEGHRLTLLGIPTPLPLAVREERYGPLRRRAWLITEYCEGPSLAEHLDPEREPAPAAANALRSLFGGLFKARISHGDLKASNLLWTGREIQLIDLDAMTQHRSAAAHRRAWARDRARLLRNWPAGSRLYRWLDEHLPPAG
jgi:tRNA A-37 threonylcarbamoyl transferase component Bud32